MDFLKERLKCVTSAGLALLTAVAVLPASVGTALAAPGSTLTSVTAKYIDAADGKEIASRETYRVTHEEKSPQKISGYTYADYTERVEHIYSHKDLTYIIGYPDKSIRAERGLTYAEAATIFYRLYDGEYPAFTRRMSNDTFSDVTAKDWFYKELETLYNTGVVNGYNRKFTPNAQITRAEFAVMAARFAGLKYTGGNKFDDVQPGYWAYGDINAAAEAGWVKGYPDGSFRPARSISRVEVMRLINGVINRGVDKDRLDELGVQNPYNDLAETFWGYCDIMEATVPHTAEDWHGVNYNDGKYNVIVEKFVDKSGRELAKKVTSKGKAEQAPKDVPAYAYLGYLKTITYTYTNGDAAPSIKKTANVKEAMAGDTLTYTVSLSNHKNAASAWKNVVLTDEIPKGLTFVDGSVYVDGKSAAHTLKSGVLSVKLGDIAAGKTVSVQFKATVNGDMYNETIYNTAVAKGDKSSACEDTDDGVYIKKGDTLPYAEKTANVTEARVGDRITYTVVMGNRKGAAYKLENAVMTDRIPPELDFADGSVQVDGRTAAYSYDEDTRTLAVSLGDIAPDAAVKVTFAGVVNETAYNKTVYNTAILSGDNFDDVQGMDKGVTVPDGRTELSVTKSADKDAAKVGDTIMYTITAANDVTAEVNIRGAVVTDVIPDALTFGGNVTVDGYSANYAYDNTARTLTVPLDDIAPGQTKEISFASTVNGDAYSQTITNTAIVGGENTPDKDAADDGVTVEDGKADGKAGTKSANKDTAKVGDTVTYSIRLENSALATAEWSGMTVSDVIPDGVTFAANVQANGTATTNYAYDSATKTLTLYPDPIAPGEQVVYTFDVTVDDGAQGMFIVNTAILEDGGKEYPMPDKGVDIDEGEALPIVSKTASVKTASVGDTFRYTVTATNGAKATAAWKNVVMTDTLPTGVKLIGNVFIGNEAALFKQSGNAVSVLVSDLAPGETATITFDVQVLDTAANTTLTNVAVLAGDNGSGTATDDGVTVSGDLPNADPTDGVYVTKDVDKTVVDVSKNADVGKDQATFTVTVGNNSKETWKTVVLKDVLDWSMLTPMVQNNVYVDGVLNNNWVLSNNGEFTLALGDIAPGEKREVKLTVKFKGEAAGKTYVNYATGAGDNGNATGKSPEIAVHSSTLAPPPGTHYQLFSGYVMGEWRPNDTVSLQEACRVAYRLISNGGNTWLDRGPVTVPEYEYEIPEEALYFVSIGILPRDAFDTTKMTEDTDYELNYEISSGGYLRIWASASQLNTLVKYATNADAGFGGKVSRLSFAKTICQVTGRDTSPDTTNYSGHITTWPDTSSVSGIVTEVSHFHNYILDAAGNEYWH